MHLGNGAITPECGAIAWGTAAIGAGLALQALRAKPLDRRQALTAGAVAATVFAAQMFNVQVLPFSSAHLVGGVLAAWVLGPPLGLLAMSFILALQAAVLGDGGLFALGANIVNMAVLPAALVALSQRVLARHSQCVADPVARPVESALVLAATCCASVILAAGLIVAEVALGRTDGQLVGLGQFASQMLASHLLIGALEAVATVGIVFALGGLTQPTGAPLRLSGLSAARLMGFGLLIALLSVPALGLASQQPDGYETALATATEQGSSLGMIAADDGLSGINARCEAWQNATVSWFAGPDMLLALLATLAAGGVVGGVAIWSSREATTPHIES